MADEKRCNGFRKSGYWKGYPCGTIPTHFYEGKWYCKNHHPLMVKTPTSDNSDYLQRAKAHIKTSDSRKRCKKLFNQGDM